MPQQALHAGIRRRALVTINASDGERAAKQHTRRRAVKRAAQRANLSVGFDCAGDSESDGADGAALAHSDSADSNSADSNSDGADDSDSVLADEQSGAQREGRTGLLTSTATGLRKRWHRRCGPCSLRQPLCRRRRRLRQLSRCITRWQLV
jgi:hypothetical protein